MSLPILLEKNICVSKTCCMKLECSQHVSAGEIREESGFRPDIKFVGTYQCNGKRAFDDDDLWGITYDSYGMISEEELIEMESNFLYDPIYYGG